MCDEFAVKKYVKRLRINKMEWVSVKDRLPDEAGYFLVFANDIINSWQQVLEFYICPEYQSREWHFLNGNDFPCIVTHWVPLPKPPKQLEDK